MLDHVQNVPNPTMKALFMTDGAHSEMFNHHQKWVRDNVKCREDLIPSLDLGVWNASGATSVRATVMK
jgi:hypothetical protein